MILGVNDAIIRLSSILHVSGDDPTQVKYFYKGVKYSPRKWR